MFRKQLEGLEPYKVNEKKYDMDLAGNENFYNIVGELKEEIKDVVSNIDFNRYPLGSAAGIKEAYSKYCNTPSKNITVGNGSDELISLIVSTFLDEKDSVAIFDVDFSMYKIYTLIKGSQIFEYKLDENYSFCVDDYIKFLNEKKPKIAFMSNPNNPTGNVVAEEDIEKILSSYNGLFVLDEAYFEFYGKTFIERISDYDNLIILRTSSKIGMAALRVGFLISNDNIISEIEKARSPYNVNAISQEIAKIVYENRDLIDKGVQDICLNKKTLESELETIKGIKVNKSYSNFILIECENIQNIKKSFEDEKIKLRFFGEGRLKKCLRLTVGSKEENKRVIDVFKRSYK